MTKLSTMEGEGEGVGGLGIAAAAGSSPPLLQYHMLFPPKPQHHRHDHDQQEEEEAKMMNMENAIVDKANSSSRKKLKLTKEQSTLLEHSFTHHHTLNLTRKQELADRLNLKPRQVQVWFQNRRARDKLKKTEAGCEMLREWCDSLSSDNRRMKRELQELRSGRSPPATAHAMMMTTTAVLTLCPSCERKCDAW